MKRFMLDPKFWWWPLLLWAVVAATGVLVEQKAAQ